MATGLLSSGSMGSTSSPISIRYVAEGICKVLITTCGSMSISLFGENALTFPASSLINSFNNTVIYLSSGEELYLTFSAGTGVCSYTVSVLEEQF